MFVRDKRIGPYTYVYLVENVREGGRTKQRIIANLGRKEIVVARGDLDRLARSVARLAQRSMVLSLGQGEAPPHAVCRRIGPALLFERLWQEAGCRAVLTALAGQRQFAFAGERAVFDGAAPPVRIGLRPGGGKVASRLPHRRHRGAAAAPPLPRDGLARRAAQRSGRGQRAGAALPQGSRRGRAVRCSRS